MAGQRERFGEGGEHEAVVMRARRWTRPAPAGPTEIVPTLLRRGSTGGTAAGRDSADPPGRSTTSQWTNPAASGSSTTRTNAAVPAGAPVHASAGDRSAPSHVASRGIAPPSLNADEVSTNRPADAAGEAAGAEGAALAVAAPAGTGGTADPATPAGEGVRASTRPDGTTEPRARRSTPALRAARRNHRDRGCDGKNREQSPHRSDSILRRLGDQPPGSRPPRSMPANADFSTRSGRATDKRVGSRGPGATVAA